MNPQIDQDGTKRWYNDQKQLHRENGPAVIYDDGGMVWYLKGIVHREDGPAVLKANGSQHWHLNGSSGRVGGPSDIFSSGTMYWSIDDNYFRSDGPVFIGPYGKREWLIGGKLVKQAPKRLKPKPSIPMEVTRKITGV